MIRRAPRSAQRRSSAASDVYKRQEQGSTQSPAHLPTADGIAHGDGVVYQQTDGDQAVSYTHIRAHETVLDLVCRILLEKKKIIW